MSMGELPILLLLTIGDDVLRKVVDLCHPLELTYLVTTCKHMRDVIISSGRVAFRTATSVVCISTTPTTNFLVQTYKPENATAVSPVDRAINLVTYLMQRQISLPSCTPQVVKTEVMKASNYRDTAFDIVRKLAKGKRTAFSDVAISGLYLSRNQVRRIRTKYLVEKEKCFPETEKTMLKKDIHKRFKKMPKKAPFPQ